MMINYLKNLAKMDYTIKYIYLHMVTYNNTGFNFYIKNGF